MDEGTVKKERDIACAVAVGVGRFTVDSPAELDKVIRCLPSGCVFVRLATDGLGADWPLSQKFGCARAQARGLMLQAAAAGLEVGLSFHVGSQQRDPGAWVKPLAGPAILVERFAALGHRVAAVNLGGGLPSRYVASYSSLGFNGFAPLRFRFLESSGDRSPAGLPR